MSSALQQLQQLQQRLPVQQVRPTRLVLTFPSWSRPSHSEDRSWSLMLGCSGTAGVGHRRSEILRESRSHRHHKRRACELRSRHESLTGRKNKCLPCRELADHFESIRRERHFGLEVCKPLLAVEPVYEHEGDELEKLGGTSTLGHRGLVRS
jgi:hypothetical protein